MNSGKLEQRYKAAEQAFIADLRVSSKSKDTLAKYSAILKSFGEWLFGETLNSVEVMNSEASEEVLPKHIIGWKQALAASGVKVNTIIDHLTILRCFFKWAVDNRYFAEQPILDSVFPKQEEIKHDVLTKEEILVLLSGRIPKYTPQGKAIRNRAMVILFIESGLRVSELINLRVKDLNFEKGYLRVANGKGNKTRMAPFPALAQEYVKSYLKRKGTAGDADAYVFTPDEADNEAGGKAPIACGNRTDAHRTDTRAEKNKPLTRQAVTLMVKGYVERLTGHKNIGAHDLRHAAASLWDDANMPLRDIQKALGHSNVTTTERVYVQILNREKAACDISHALDTLREQKLRRIEAAVPDGTEQNSQISMQV